MKAAVVIGAGACGTHAALALRHEGWAGPIHLIGAETYCPYDRSVLSKPGNSPRAILRLISNPSTYDSEKITLHVGSNAVSIDAAKKTVALNDGTYVAYEKLLIATGARPLELSCEGHERARTISTFEDAQWLSSAAAVGKNAVIVGSGLLGMELAATLRTWGLNVTIIEVEKRGLNETIPQEFADRLVGHHCSEGVTFRFGRRVRHIGSESVELDDGSRVVADLVISAIGTRSRTAIAQTCDLTVDRGIVVNQRFQTTDPAIFAAGDCAIICDSENLKPFRSSHWLTAKSQGEAAARSMLNKDPGCLVLPTIKSSQYDMMLLISGSPLGGDEIIVRAGADYTLLFNIDMEGRVMGVSALGKSGSVDAIMQSAEPLISRRFGEGRFRLADANTDLRKLLRRTRKVGTADKV